MENNFNLDMDVIPKELSLLLEILKMENDDNILRAKSELFMNIDWELFLQLAKHHRVYPLIYSKLKRLDEKLIPLHVIETLYQEYKNNTFQMLQLSSEMERVSKLFTENQIYSLFLKGPVIAAEIYGDISLRTSKDLDILIPKKDLKRAEELLLNYGYKREETPVVFGEWKWMNHHVAYFHPQKRIQLEIHWRLHPPPTKEPSFNELWERKRISMLTSYPVYFLGKEDLFLFLVEHGARHGWFRLRWLADIDQIIRKKYISEKNNLIIKKHLTYYLGGQVFILTSQLLKTPINEENHLLTVGKRPRKLAQLAIYYIIEMAHLEINQYKDDLPKSNNFYPFSIKSNLQNSFLFNRYQFSIKSNFQKFVFVIKLLFPSFEDVKTLRLPNSLHFLYFPLRPFLWAWRKTRKVT